MYNFSGIYFQMMKDTILFGTMAIVCLLVSRFWNSEKRNKEYIMGAILAIVIVLSSIIDNSYALKHQKVLACEGVLLTEKRKNRYTVLAQEFVFKNDNGRKITCYLDLFSKKEIYPEGFELDQKYRVYYEEKTKIIVKVEKIE